ncbi:MAG: RsmB/NOP family class I SAM-dependent RNA methyltransferase [Atopobiaceae bacterium]
MTGKKTKLSPARAAALSLVSEQRRRQARLRDLMRTSPELERLYPEDRALASRLALGCVQTRGALDADISKHLSRKGHLEPKVADALALAAFELLFMKTPAAVAVSQGVELVRSQSPRAAGLANAVLHRILEEDVPACHEAQAKIKDVPDTATVEDLALATGQPAWLCEKIAASAGKSAAAASLAALAEPAPVYVAANRGVTDAQALESELVEAGLAPEATGLPGSFVLARPQKLFSSGLVGAVEAVPADLSAQEVALIAAPRPGESMLEIGQGRGTKTLLLLSAQKMFAEHAGGKQEVARYVALDAEGFKTKLAGERLEKGGWEGRVRCTTFDGTKLGDGESLPKELSGTFDTVFVDAPCSGTGTLRRHPELSWSLAPSAIDPENAEGLPALQLALLGAAAARVAPQGRLVYATCSVLREEDEDIVSAFLAGEAGRGFEIEDVGKAPALSLWPEAELPVTEEGFFRSSPVLKGPDGHFCCVLRKKQ